MQAVRIVLQPSPPLSAPLTLRWTDAADRDMVPSLSATRRRVALLLFVPLLAPAYFTFDSASSLYASRRLIRRADALVGEHYPGQAARDHAIERWAKRRAKRSARAAPAECRSFFETGPLINASGHVEPLAVPAKGEVFSKSETRRAEATPDTIFFLSTYRNFPQPQTDESLCAVEAAARMYPSHRVDIWTPHPDDLARSLLSTLTPLPSLGPEADPVLLLAAWQRRLPPDHFLARIRIRTLADDAVLLADTPLAEWYDSGRYNDSLWISQNLGNAARLSILWHEGGTYQDLDILAINSAVRTGGVGRVLAMQDRSLFYVNNAVITVPPKDPLIWAAMEEFNATFDGNIWRVPLLSFADTS